MVPEDQDCDTLRLILSQGIMIIDLGKKPLRLWAVIASWELTMEFVANAGTHSRGENGTGLYVRNRSDTEKSHLMRLVEARPACALQLALAPPIRACGQRHHKRVRS